MAAGIAVCKQRERVRNGSRAEECYILGKQLKHIDNTLLAEANVQCSFRALHIVADHEAHSAGASLVLTSELYPVSEMHPSLCMSAALKGV